MPSPAASVVIPARDPPPVLHDVFSALAGQALEDGQRLEVIVVDDGSCPAIRPPGDMNFPVLDIRILRREHSQGRAAARNAGAAAAQGEFVLFLDCDCVPQTTGWANAHIRALRDGAVATAGAVEGEDSGFWHRYQSDSSRRRADQQANGYPCGSTQNLGTRKAAFGTVLGFDASYVGYGFEDRDLLARMAEVGPLAWVEDARVSHRDVVRLGVIAHKMAEAGRTTALQFRQRHPEAYRMLGYAAIDTDLHPLLRLIACVLGPLALRVAPRIDPWLASDWLPYPLRKALVKAISALSFLYGTSRRSKEA
ncbi:MAG: glycosyltransferase [Gammaproteobacteria bacterium]